MLSLDEADREWIASFRGRWRVAELALFGSALRDDFRPDSDVDILITFTPDPPWSLLDIVTMKQELETHFGRPVDLADRTAVERSTNWVRKREILRSAEVVYAAG